MTPKEEQGLVRLRVELYCAARLLKGDALAHFTELIKEIAMVLELLPVSSSSSSVILPLAEQGRLRDEH